MAEVETMAPVQRVTGPSPRISVTAMHAEEEGMVSMDAVEE